MIVEHEYIHFPYRDGFGGIVVAYETAFDQPPQPSDCEWLIPGTNNEDPFRRV